ncbi:stage V sporulation protein AD [Sarcina sp. JB2]|uniref:Stage V sporulation protein AD n=1 Tax=Candidatus Sarcina troglodytae TaxID=2726954 RepID=A0ACD1BER2_9CLOT|nr:stage V sporulation protein AD [Sarcina sp. JB2]QPJ85931.1 stage V sporulation protein AD [Sarcina sp. JB2]
MSKLEKRLGGQTVVLESKPKIIATHSVVGKKESEGPLKDYFDDVVKDDQNGKKSFEKAETSMMIKAISNVIKKGNLKEEDIDYLLAGDLLNQLTSTSFMAREFNIPFFGLYGACSTMAESLSLAGLILDGGFANHVIAATSSNFSAAERQFRFPLEYGSQRKEQAQWTVTGAGAILLGRYGDLPYLTHVTTGVVKDYGIKESDNMGAAMAPAAVDTLYKHFKDTGREPKDYDIIVTGDLGKIGKSLTENLILDYGYDIRGVYTDCGVEIFNNDDNDIKSGGSGCGCSAVVFCGYLYKQLMAKKLKRVLLVSTGALMSSTSSLQGESIPGIAHAVSIEYM